MLTSRARPTNCTTCASTHTCIWPHAVCCRHSYDAGRGPPHPQSTPFSSSLFVPRVSLHVAREGVRQQHTTMLWHLSYPPSHLTYMLASRTADGAAAHLVRTSPPGVGGWHPPTHTPTPVQTPPCASLWQRLVIPRMQDTSVHAFDTFHLHCCQATGVHGPGVCIPC